MAESSFRARLARARPRTSWRGAELVLALLVVGAVAMMIVPLPTWLLDLLIAANLSASVGIPAQFVVYVPDALAIAAFPTLLLLTTLYRLALNVSSARLILLQTDAGEIIHAFGSFVVRGNCVVGAIVFSILTVIQFVVDREGRRARGGGRGAIDVLDALPGRQMAIDAEQPAGGGEARSTRGPEARRPAGASSRERASFCGAMDGGR